MKYKVGDKVRIKSLDWYNANKDKDGRVYCSYICFCKEMSKYCGEVLTIMTIGNQDIGSKQKYFMHETDYAWGFTDEMIECLAIEDKPQVEQVSSKHHYIGKYVHAGGELNGIVGHIVDVKHESDDIFGEELWFYIKDEEDGTIHRYCKEEIQEIVIGITYKDLE